MTKSQNTPNDGIRKMTKEELLMSEIESLNATIALLSDENAAMHAVIERSNEAVKDAKTDLLSVSEILEKKNARLTQKNEMLAKAETRATMAEAKMEAAIHDLDTAYSGMKDLEQVICGLQMQLDSQENEMKEYAKQKNGLIHTLQDEILGLQVKVDMAEGMAEDLQLELDQALAEDITPEEYSSINRALEETMPNHTPKPKGYNSLIEQARAAKSAARIQMEGKAVHAGIHAAERVLIQFSKDTVKMHAAHCDLQAQMTPEERMHTVDKQHNLLSTVVTETMPMLKQFAEFLAWKAMNEE